MFDIPSRLWICGWGTGISRYLAFFTDSEILLGSINLVLYLWLISGCNAFQEFCTIIKTCNYFVVTFDPYVPSQMYRNKLLIYMLIVNCYYCELLWITKLEGQHRLYFNISLQWLHRIPVANWWLVIVIISVGFSPLTHPRIETQSFSFLENRGVTSEVPSFFQKLLKLTLLSSWKESVSHRRNQKCLSCMLGFSLSCAIPRFFCVILFHNTSAGQDLLI